MNRLTVLVDISSRVMHATEGSPRTVAGAVAVETDSLKFLRSEMQGVPKWKNAKESDIAHVVDVLKSQAAAVAIISMNRNNAAWRKFITEATLLHEAILKDSRQVARWASASNLLKFILLGTASAAATGHAIGTGKRSGILNRQGLQIVECQTICDNEIEGAENLEVFKSFWSAQHQPTKRFEQFGFEMSSNTVSLTTEQEEPALLLPDYVAGLGLAYTLENQGSRPLPATKERACEFLKTMNARGKVVVQKEEFEHSYDEIFGSVMDMARSLTTKTV